jgi:hypothetical protein
VGDGSGNGTAVPVGGAVRAQAFRMSRKDKIKEGTKSSLFICTPQAGKPKHSAELEFNITLAYGFVFILLNWIELEVINRQLPKQYSAHGKMKPLYLLTCTGAAGHAGHFCLFIQVEPAISTRPFFLKPVDIYGLHNTTFSL